MSHPLDMVVFKPFFVQLRLPYKAVRLEEVTVNIGIYNYKPFDINVSMSWEPLQEICLNCIAWMGLFRLQPDLGIQIFFSESNKMALKCVLSVNCLL